jgi:hypothetical protein
MESVTGVFRSAEHARRAAVELRHAGFAPEHLSLLFPGASEAEIHSVPVSETEQPGMGTAIGSVVGAALGMAGGFELWGVGATASLLVPGVGPVLAIGLAGAALLGIGGGLGGAAIGSAMEHKSTEGVPADEIFFYEDALRQGRSVLVAMTKDATEAARAKELLAEAGAETVDAAREDWWLGLRDAEREHYQALGHNWEQDAKEYRAGFEASLRRPARGKQFMEAAGYLRSEYSEVWEHPAFRKGFERGQDYLQRRENPAIPDVIGPPTLR